MTPKFNKAIRLDSLPLGQTYTTPEGYLVDRPILTSTGIFEYHNADGSVRRELRLPEDVFDPESLKSYKGRPIIITHNAGLVNKDNVHKNQIGTILSEGYRSTDDVRAEIIIHDTDEMKEAGLKELSLGYNLDLEETPGEWNGQHYDAIQRNIRINHLALVREARAGEQARLNIDSRDNENILKGGKAVMSNEKKPTVKTNATRTDGTLTPEEFEKAIEEYKARRAKRENENQDAETPAVTKEGAAKAEETPAADAEKATEEKPAAVSGTKHEPPVQENAEKKDSDTPEEQVQAVKDRQAKRAEDGAPADMEAANKVIAHQDEDIGLLYDIIDTLLARADYDKANGDAANDNGELEEGKTEEGEETPVENKDGENVATPEAKEEKPTMNADSVDAIVRQRIQLGILGNKLNMDGLENMSITDAKKAIIRNVRPSMNLDGKSDAYINAAFDCTLNDVEAQKGVSHQKQQMFNKDSNSAEDIEAQSSAAHRQRMIDRQMKKEDK